MKKIKMPQNIGLRLIALIAAAVLWLVVVNISDPIDSVSFNNIPVTIINEEVVTNQGKVFQVVDNVQTVRVTVSAQRQILSRISASNIVATADLSQMEVNTLLVPITATVRGYESSGIVTVATPNNLQVKIEDMTKNNFPISVSATGTPRDGYVVGSMTTNPEKITIRGSDSMINNIQKVVAKVDVSGLSESSVLDAELILYDGNGNPMDQSQLTNNLGEEGISVNVEILNTKSVGMKFEVSGEPADGYVYTGYTVEPDKIQVCATKEVLAGLDYIEIPSDEIDITGADGRMEVTVDIGAYLPEGVRLVDQTANNVIVSVAIEQEGARTIELPVEAIRVKNLDENLKVAFESERDLELRFTGAQDVLDILDIRNAASIDLKSYTTEGTYEVPVNIETVEGVTLTEEPKVKIILTEKKSE